LPFPAQKPYRSLDKTWDGCQFRRYDNDGNAMKPADERITDLEVLAAEQERTIAELSEQIADQWKVIERLQKKLDALTERFLELEEQAAPDIPVTRPPHW